ncbi:hypothetical protein [Candidatus Williamhamiltonella defendens]|nr:hypothetical protein [Candidatus Hamiltonella defensa]
MSKSIYLQNLMSVCINNALYYSSNLLFTLALWVLEVSIFRRTA